MLTCYAAATGLAPAPTEALLHTADWIDIEAPTAAETELVERATGLHVPSLAELSEIESSSRLGTVGGALYLSMPWLVGVRGNAPRTTVLGFVVTPQRLLSIRFGESLVMQTFTDRLATQCRTDPKLTAAAGPVHVFAGILEAIVDRFADVLEQIGAKLDEVSATVFDARTGSGRRPRHEDARLRELLREVGRAGDIVSRLRDCLLAVGRIVQYVQQTAQDWLPPDLKGRFKTLHQDVHSLTDHDGYLINKVQFLLDATLGFISIAQNNIIKVLTVVSVVGVPPTLVASIYGMNFKTMPELDWSYGYPYGLTMIALSAVVPLLLFRLRGWL
jgi:magnesium transporter